MAFHGWKEKLYQNNNGIFLSLIEMIAEFDPVMQEHVRLIKSGELKKHYLGHKIQNESIQLLSLEINDTILKQIRDSKYFSAILDCTPYISHQEQITLVLQCVNVSKTPVSIDEYFIEFIKIDNIT